ncbi:unnamed protein product [Cladocopium goreaui]|uniref:Uncharacterized protein n=1 Tax=Cladocopium goreaui TaxID=2562237 RepID=A0A9P1BH53_9DINO|nr:unnamed protein product [Cladocopium goreaui]
MSLTEPITAAALEASPAPDGEASLLSEHSADIARFHAAVAQNRRLLGDRPGTGTGTAGPGATARPSASAAEFAAPAEPVTRGRPPSPPKRQPWEVPRSRSADAPGRGWCQEFPWGASDTRTLIREDRRRYLELQRRKLKDELQGLAKAELVEKILHWCSTLGIWNLNDLEHAMQRRVDATRPRPRDECARCGTKHLKDGNFCRRCGQRRQTTLSCVKCAAAKAKEQREVAEIALSRVRLEEFEAL